MATTLFGQVDAGATLSDCGLYRYDLWRRWVTGPTLAFIMLNPSVADATVTDPTLGRCIGFARRDGFGALLLRNLFAFRTHRPSYLTTAHRAGRDVVGPENDMWLQTLPERDDVSAIVAAWGQGSGIPKALFQRRVGGVLDVLGRDNVQALDPIPYRGPAPHPLYLPAETPIVSYPAKRPA